MQQKPLWGCEMCGKLYDTPYAVRDAVCVENGENSRAYAYTCVKCIKAVVELFDREFPNNKYLLRMLEKERILGERTVATAK